MTIKTNAHTPGPWKLQYRHANDLRIIAGELQYEGQSQVITIAILGNWAAEHERERLANANLIAAAPELLAAVESASKLLCRLRERGTIGNAPEIQMLGEARAKAVGDKLALCAIRKAKGES